MDTFVKSNGYEAVYADAGSDQEKQIEDVEGFIANGGKGCKCSGCWKVYGDVEKAQALFDSYKECRRRLMTQWNHGASVTSLAVAL